MIIFPAIDIKDGKVVRLRQGKKSEVEVFANNPLDFAMRWQDEGAEWLHVIDLDGAFAGSSINQDAIKKIARQTSLKIQVGGGIRDFETAQAYLSLGITRIIIGTIALENPGLFDKIASEFPEKVGVSLDASNGQLKTRGWVQNSALDMKQALAQLQKTAFIIYTDIERDGMGSGINLNALRNILHITNKPVIAAGGIGCSDDLRNVASLAPEGNLEGVVIGKALYTGTVSLPEALNIMNK